MLEQLGLNLVQAFSKCLSLIMLITATSIQQQDHRDMASSEAEIDIKGSRVYFMMWSFSLYQKDDVVSISLCPSSIL